MRVMPALGLSLLVSVGSLSGGMASDLRQDAFAPVGVPAPRSGLLSEFRLGASAQDPWGPESNSANLTGEILFAKPFTTADLFTSYFIPRPHIGGSVNLSGETSFAYAGLTWTVDITPRVFIEGTFGGAIHNGETGKLVPVGRAALGCSPLFRESGSIGVRLSANWSLLATVEHLSNAGLCDQNRGLTNIGARVGYTF